MPYCTAEEVIELTGVKPIHLRLEEDDTQGLNDRLTKWINQCESIINSYCNQSWDNEVPGAVQNVALRLVANMVAFAQVRKDTPLVKVNDWKIQFSSSRIFTSDLKDDLKPYKIDKSNKSDSIEFEAITGD